MSTLRTEAGGTHAVCFIFLKNEIVRMIPQFFQAGALHIPDTALKKRNGRPETVRTLQYLPYQNGFILYCVYARCIRGESIASLERIHRERSKEGIFIAQFITFHIFTFQKHHRNLSCFSQKSELFRLSPCQQHDAFDVERYLLIDVRVTACSRKHIISKRKQVHACQKT